MTKTIIGWQEWCSLPELTLPVIKAKIDTGAKTSALHAFDIQTLNIKDETFVEFSVHPLQNRVDVVKRCVAPLAGKRSISDSGGHREMRYIIKTSMIIGTQVQDAEISLTNRHEMAFRMLIGRAALNKHFIVDSGSSFLLGKVPKRIITASYLGTAE